MGWCRVVETPRPRYPIMKPTLIAFIIAALALPFVSLQAGPAKGGGTGQAEAGKKKPDGPGERHDGKGKGKGKGKKGKGDGKGKKGEGKGGN